MLSPRASTSTAMLAGVMLTFAIAHMIGPQHQLVASPEDRLWRIATRRGWWPGTSARGAVARPDGGIKYLPVESNNGERDVQSVTNLGTEMRARASEATLILGRSWRFIAESQKFLGEPGQRLQKGKKNWRPRPA